MKKLTLTKYITTALKFFIPFVLIGALCLVLWISDALASEILLFIAVAVNGIALFLPSVYYFSMYLIFKKKCEGRTPTEGVVTNWELGFFRYSGSIIVDGTEKWYQMMADGVRYQRFEGDKYNNGGPYSTQWEVDDAPSEKPWLIQFDFDAVETVFLSHDAALGGQEMVAFNVITGEKDGFTTGYTLTFYLDDGILENAVRTTERTYPDGPLEAERSTVTTTVVSTDTQEAATMISQAHGEAVAVQRFSWAEVVETYTWDAPQIHWDGFANTTPLTITSQADAIRAAEAECTIAYSAVYTHYDPDAQMWAVSFREGGEFGWTQDVYLDSNGITRLIVDGDPALSGQN